MNPDFEKELIKLRKKFNLQGREMGLQATSDLKIIAWLQQVAGVQELKYLDMKKSSEQWWSES